MPMWCSSSDAPGPPPSNIPQAHHRIVRIPPGESVVLNSAERAPYVLILEILNGDLDFDPAKRNNKEILKKIVEKENERKGASNDLVTFTRRDSVRDKDLPQAPVDGDADTKPESETQEPEIGLGEAETGKEFYGPPPIIATIPPTPTAPLSPRGQEEEEIDLVEQLYGAGQSLRSKTVDLSESVVLPAALKNRDLDMAAWTSSNPVTPISTVSTSGGPTFARAQASPTIVDGSEAGLSMDEYAERMRTAAVMLAQLNANMMREPVAAATVPGVPPSDATARGWTSWIPGASAADSAAAKGPVHPTLANASPRPDSAAAPQMRMKLQPAEATAIRERIMKEMLALEEERMARMRERESSSGSGFMAVRDTASGSGAAKSAEDEGIIRRELNKADPSAVVFSESWAAKKVCRSRCF
jgi:phosphatidylinositol 4-kinase B